MAFNQPATFNEAWTDSRVESYLSLSAPKGVNLDYHILLTAFKHMRPEDYERLVTRFVNQGRNLNAVGPYGKTIVEELACYPRQAHPFIEILNKYQS